MNDMNGKYLELVTFLQDATDNTEQFMSGEICPFRDKVKKDVMYEKLLQPSRYDEACQAFLKVILAAL